MSAKRPYIVTGAADGSVKIAGRYLRAGDTAMLTDAEAEWEIRRGLVEPRHALDRDGDGRKGGSLPRDAARSSRRGRT